MSILLQSVHYEAFQRAAITAAVALIAGFWQGIALALLTAVTLRFLPRTTATARFALWSSVFAVLAALPLLHLASSTQTVNTTSTGPLLLNPRWSYLVAGMWAATATFRLVMLMIEAGGLRQLWRTAEPIADESLERAGLQIVLADCGVDGMNHIAFMMPDFESVMRGSGRMVDHGHPIGWGVGRHGPGDNIFAYFVDPMGFVIEYTAEVLQVDDAYAVGTPDRWVWPPGRTDHWGIAPPKPDYVKHAQLAIPFASPTATAE